MIRLVTIDLDGTLLDSNSNISDKNRKAIIWCQDNGIKVVLCTGKSMQCSGEVIRKLGLKHLQIVSGGTMVIDHNFKPIASIKIPQQDVVEAVKLARKNNIGFVLDTIGGELLYDRDFPELKYFLESGEKAKKVKDILDDDIISNALIFTITVNNTHPFNSILRESITDGVKIRRGGPHYLNVMNSNAGKLAGLKKVISIYGIEPEEVMVIGDNDNDLGTLEYAGFSVAMGNAPEEVKQAAGYITEDNDNSGVAKALEKFIMERSEIS